MANPTADEKAMAACPVAMQVTEDDILADRVKPYVIQPSESALLTARMAFFDSSDQTLRAMASAEKAFKESALGRTSGSRITDALGVCNTRKEIELMDLAGSLIDARFGRVAPGQLSETRSYLIEAMADAFTMIAFHDRFTPSQIQEYYGPYRLLTPFPLAL